MLLMPLVTVVAASAVFGQAVTPAFVVGGALVLTGVYIGAVGRRRTAGATGRVIAFSDRRPNPGARSEPGRMELVNIVLVHGSYAGAWVWDLVRPDLEGRGHRVTPSTCPSATRTRAPRRTRGPSPTPSTGPSRPSWWATR